VEEFLEERGVGVDHTTVFRWVQRYGLELDKRCRPSLRATNDSYCVDEIYIKIKKQWHYLYRAVDSTEATLFQNVRIFDGKTAALSTPSDVLVKGNTIARISASPITVDPETTVIAAGGRVLMPGLIDAHWHAFMATTPQPLLMTADPSYLHLLAARQAEATLMRGFTTVRDLGGPVFGLKRAIDEDVMMGPRIYPSGAFISQTSGHGDFRFTFEVPLTLGGQLSHSEVEGLAAIADSPDEVRLRAREQLRQGASQLKLMAGGGVASPYNPIESTQYTEAEMRAAVEAAEHWGTYVTVHAYTPRAIRQAVAAGVQCIGTWSAHRRAHRPVTGGERHLVEPAASAG
jgi:imidazolonepropionase-like amidohydrolase